MTDDCVVRTYRQNWRSSPILTGAVKKNGRSSSGASGVFVLTLDGQYTGFGKAAVNTAGAPEGAHEFIASRLAEMVGIPVPPACFWYDETVTPFVITIRAFKQPMRWQDARRFLTDADRASLSNFFAAGCVFHSWINDIDHNDLDDNVVRGAKVWAVRRYFLAPARFGSILSGYAPSRASFQSEPSRA